MASFPFFSLPTNRTDYNNVTQMLTNFFISKGLSAGDAAAQAGLVLNLKGQGLSDSEIDTAIATQQNRLNSITASNVAAAKAALAAQAPEVAAAKQAMQAATLQHASSGDQNKLITVNGVTETKKQAANFADNKTGCMEADPGNPRGPQITCAEAALKRQQKLTSSFSNSDIANAPATSKVVAINGIQVADKTQKPTVPQPQPDIIKSGITTAQNAISTAISNGSSAIKAVTSALNTVGKTVQSDVGVVAQDLGLAPKTTTENSLVSVTLDSKTTTGYHVTEKFSDGSTAKSTWTQNTLDVERSNGVQIIDNTGSTSSPSSSTQNDPIKQLTDFFANLFKPATPQPQQPAQPQQADFIKQAQDKIAAGEKALADAGANAVTQITGLLGKLTGGATPSTDPSKSSTSSSGSTSSSSDSGSAQPPATGGATSDQQPPTGDQPPAPPQTFTQQTIAFLKKYSLPIAIGIGATASLGIALSYNSKQGIIQR